MEERTGWRGQNESQIIGEEKKNGRLVGAAKTSKERAEWRRLQRKNLSILGLPKRNEWSQIPRRKGRASNKSVSRRCRRKHERVSGRKSSPRQSAVLVSLQVWPNLKQERRLGDEGPAHKIKRVK